MIQFAVRRLFTTLPTLFIVTVLVFALVHLLPGDPARIMLGEGATPESVIALREKLGFDRSLPEQYLRWLADIARLDFGNSLRNLPVTTLIAEKLPITLELAVLSTLLSMVIAVPVGLFSALKPGGLLDRTLTLLALCGISLPTFFAGIILIYIFSVRLAWIPAGGYVSFFENPARNLTLMILPSVTLGAFSAAVLSRYMRSSMLEAMSQDYIRTAAAKGARTFTVVVKHGLRNALVPVVTALGLQLGTLLGGAVVTEQIFSVPGFGNLLVYSVYNRDFLVIQGLVLVIALAVFLVSFLVDLAYAAIDPRIRYQ
ncbi:ABC transporter permease [Deinococcus yavapaiensis]|uniref:Peptide/nickel transport system permease protein n=1 Tax=Deinococcus yavapaiensis KR-236 TaxID=694435 RepID=A0A318S0F6_9DEIO|nr:ABC transporter permease [Deinococcus yavapaiensis]PYE50386.1 peptide/nickel transport system permease protein [Deinococcus yavapaiensis KR-236]